MKNLYYQENEITVLFKDLSTGKIFNSVIDSIQCIANQVYLKYDSLTFKVEGQINNVVIDANSEFKSEISVYGYRLVMKEIK